MIKSTYSLVFIFLKGIWGLCSIGMIKSFVVFILLKGICVVIFFEKILRMRCDDGRNNIDKLEFMLAVKEMTAECF